MRQLKIGQTLIDDVNRPFVIAEIGHNHGGDLLLAESMALSAKAHGASAVKFQTRHPQDVYQMTDKRGGFLFRSANPQWMNPVYGLHREALEFTHPEWEALFAYCKRLGITAISTPFDFKSADLLARLEVPAFKIASGDATNIPLIEHVAGFGKPVLVSTGGCTLTEVERIVRAVPSGRLGLLQCSCVYPAPARLQNLLVIERYRELFPDVVVGLSSHNPNWWVNAGAYMLGARIFENHFTTDRKLKGTDNPFSLTPEMMLDFVMALDEIRDGMGSTRKFTTPEEIEPTLERRKKCVWARDLPAGHVVTLEDIAFKCPGDGLPPYLGSRLVGSILTAPVKADTDLPWNPEDHDGVFADFLAQREAERAHTA